MMGQSTLLRSRPRLAALMVSLALVSLHGALGASTLSRNDQKAPERGTGSPRNPDEAEIRGLVTRLVDEWNEGNADRAAAVFDEDGDLIAGNGTYAAGRVAIAQYLQQLLPAFPKGTRFTTDVSHVRFLSADAALLQCRGGFLMPGESELRPERRGIQSLVAIKSDGRWRVALFQNTRMSH